MSKSQGFSEAIRALSAWFERQKRVLPWRDNPSTYRVWVSEIMLQQTQVATVIPYFERFMARFPTVESLATAPAEDVMAHWAGLGYYSRARNLQATAKQVALAGGFPTARDGWLDLPGVGPYTAGAILSIAANRPEPILDGNVERVLSRVRRVSRGRGDAIFKTRLWRLARLFVESADRLGVAPSVLNQALMELGATLCAPRGEPACLLCPLNSICRARAEGDQAAYPPAKRAKEWERVEERLHCWVRVQDGRPHLRLRLRGEGEWRAGLWDFMDGPPVESAAKCLGEVETRHVVTNHKIRRVTKIWCLPKAGVTLMRAEEPGAPSADDSRAETQARWVPLDEPGVPAGSAATRTLTRIRADFGERFGT